MAACLPRAFALLFAASLPLEGFGGLEWPGCGQEVVAAFPGGWPQNLDWGLYWFSQDGHSEKAMPGQKPTLYDPKNNTVIFFHGWLGDGEGSTKYCYRPTPFCDPDVCKDSANMFKAWFQKGWNVGFFYWDQFADEPCTRDAEQKIWLDNGHNGLRWASWNGNEKTYKAYASLPNATTSIGDMCADTIAGALGQFAGQSLRFVGHSIGAQLAATCATRLHAAGVPARPTRLTMLDPIFTERHLKIFRCQSVALDAGVGDLAPQSTSTSVSTLRNRGVPTEVYKSSQYSQNAYLFDPNTNLQQETLLVKYEPDWCDDMYSQYNILQNWECRHKAAIFSYFLGKGVPPPPLVNGNLYAMPGACVTPSAACRDEEIDNLAKARENAQVYKHENGWWKQVAGAATSALEDDQFKLEKAEVKGGASVTTQPKEMQQAEEALASTLTPSLAANASSGALSTPAYQKRREGAVDFLALKARWRYMPIGTKILVIGLAVVGFTLLCYGLQPVCPQCCCCCFLRRERFFGASSFDSFDDDSNWEDFGREEFNDYMVGKVSGARVAPRYGG